MALRRDPIALFTAARDFAPLTRVRMGPVTIQVLTAPHHVQHVFVKRADNYVKQTRGYAVLRTVLGNGLVTNEGDAWKRQRRIANPAFHRNCVAGFADTMRIATEDWIAALPTDPHERDLAHDLHRLTLRIAGETLLGMDLSAEGDRVGNALSVVLPHFTQRTQSLLPWADKLPTPSNRRFRRAVADMDDVVYGVIRERRNNPESRPDLLGLFMDARDTETDEGMSDEQLRDEALTLLLAGHETTANLLAWTLHVLTTHPEWAEAVTAEVDAVVGDGPVGFEQLGQLDLTSRVIDETLRLYPPVWISGRTAVEDDVVDGFTIPAGTHVYVPTLAIHRHPDFWSKPEAFDPDRFLPDNKRTIPDGAYHPFSLGRRKCIGDRFAKMEAVILLATLLRKLRFSSVTGQPVTPEPLLTLRPRGGLPLRVSQRIR